MYEQKYTQFISDSTYQFLDEESSYDAVAFLTNPQNFRTFDAGLKETLIKKGVSDTDSSDKITNEIFSKLSAIGSTITRSTVNSWVLGTHRPKIESSYRKQIYELCFALDLSLDETRWFFHHVYYDRAFNCHTIDESVYFYAIKQGLSYSDTQSIIKKIMEAPCTEKANHVQGNYTQFVTTRLNEISNTDELVAFLVHNKENFNSWNQSAYQTLKELLQELTPTVEGKKNIDNLIRTIKRKNKIIGILPSPAKNNEWGLVMQEFFTSILINEDDSPDAISFELKGVNIRSNTFILDRILSSSTGLPKATKQNDTSQHPYALIKTNFPSKKTMSDVLSEEKVSQSKSYDSIRKMLILLYFYRFWCNIKIHGSNDDEIALSDTFIDEINYLLNNCGYEEIYAGNPYDWLFLTASQADDPLTYFRQCVDSLVDD